MMQLQAYFTMQLFGIVVFSRLQQATSGGGVALVACRHRHARHKGRKLEIKKNQNKISYLDKKKKKKKTNLQGFST